jgi:hypothetical protein
MLTSCARRKSLCIRVLNNKSSRWSQAEGVSFGLCAFVTHPFSVETSGKGRASDWFDVFPTKVGEIVLKGQQALRIFGEKLVT